MYCKVCKVITGLFKGHIKSQDCLNKLLCSLNSPLQKFSTLYYIRDDGWTLWSCNGIKEFSSWNLSISPLREQFHAWFSSTRIRMVIYAFPPSHHLCCDIGFPNSPVYSAVFFSCCLQLFLKKHVSLYKKQSRKRKHACVRERWCSGCNEATVCCRQHVSKLINAAASKLL